MCLQHDPNPGQCAPGGDVGNFIMFASAAQGNFPNNNKFSACSRDYIAKVLETLGGIRSDCFKGKHACLLVYLPAHPPDFQPVSLIVSPPACLYTMHA